MQDRGYKYAQGPPLKGPQSHPLTFNLNYHLIFQESCLPRLLIYLTSKGTSCLYRSGLCFHQLNHYLDSLGFPKRVEDFIFFTINGDVSSFRSIIGSEQFMELITPVS
jgi:hypothetical protein